jgi:membrane glycosyltransferase
LSVPVYPKILYEIMNIQNMKAIQAGILILAIILFLATSIALIVALSLLIPVS